MLSFDDLSRGVDRRVAATSFMEILQLKTWGLLQADQNDPFDDIKITATVQILNFLTLQCAIVLFVGILRRTKHGPRKSNCNNSSELV